MAVANDKLTEMVHRSVHDFLSTNAGLVGLTAVRIASPDFDHDLETPPYAAIVAGQEETLPFEVGNGRIQRNVSFFVWVACASHVETLRIPQRVQQLFLTSEVDGVDGAIPLLDFDVSPAADAGYVEIMADLVSPGSLDIVPGLEIDLRAKWRNLKHVGVLSLRVEEEKVKEAELIE